jgi:hypothetical protein
MPYKHSIYDQWSGIKKAVIEQREIKKHFSEDRINDEVSFRCDYGDILADYVSWIKSNVGGSEIQLTLLTDFIVFSSTHPDRFKVYQFVNKEKQRLDRLYVRGTKQ